jgi:hypothetical protein
MPRAFVCAAQSARIGDDVIEALEVFARYRQHVRTVVSTAEILADQVKKLIAVLRSQLQAIEDKSLNPAVFRVTGGEELILQYAGTDVRFGHGDWIA